MFGRSAAVSLVSLGLACRLAAQNSPITHWCAAPRTNDPLLQEARALGTSTDSAWAAKRDAYRIAAVPSDQVARVQDEAICQRAAIAYRDYFRRFVKPDWPDAPVLVVRIGEMYLVDDLRQRKGDDAYWEVIVFDKTWKRRSSYGDGA